MSRDTGVNIEPKRDAVILEFIPTAGRFVVHIECKDRERMPLLKETAQHILYLIEHQGLGCSPAMSDHLELPMSGEPMTDVLSVPDESLAALADEFERTREPIRNASIALFLRGCGVANDDTRRGADVAREMIDWIDSEILGERPTRVAAKSYL